MAIELKSPAQLGLMREAGLVVAAALAAVQEAVKPGVTTADLDQIAEDVIRSHGAVPSFKGYQGFPATICSSVNEQVVHTIPSAGQVLQEGDIISVDCGAILSGWHGDAAITVGVGQIRPELEELSRITEDALWAGIAVAARGVRTGKGRLTDISYTIESTVRKARRHYGIVRGYGGHGIGSQMHQDPHVHNHGRPESGPRLVPGMALAIEPMVTLGSPRTRELSDGWTVVTMDQLPAAHFEHSVGFYEDGVVVFTAADGGRARLGELVSTAIEGH